METGHKVAFCVLKNIYVKNEGSTISHMGIRGQYRRKEIWLTLSNYLMCMYILGAYVCMYARYEVFMITHVTRRTGHR